MNIQAWSEEFRYLTVGIAVGKIKYDAVRQSIRIHIPPHRVVFTDACTPTEAADYVRLTRDRHLN